jgi:hypothetical protein
VYGERAAIQCENDKFPAPADSLNGSSGETRGELLAISGCDEAGRERGGDDPAAGEVGGEGPHDGFDFRELRHLLKRAQRCAVRSHFL